MFILNFVITSCYASNIFKLTGVVTDITYWIFLLFLIIKYILGTKNVIWICNNYQSWRRAPGMRYHGFVYANFNITINVLNKIIYY